MYQEINQERGLAPETLSRQIEGSGTVTSPLVPCNSCGAYMSATLGIATLAYLPFCFLDLLDVTVTFLFAILGFKIRRTEPEEASFRGIGGQRVNPTEHEVTVREDGSGHVHTYVGQWLRNYNCQSFRLSQWSRKKEV